jgi:hypothetical protein
MNPVTPAQRQKARIKKFRPFANELGWILFEWNSLHEAFCQIFADLLAPADREIAYAIWHSNPSDRAQREMLSSALKVIKSKDKGLLKLCDGASYALEKMRKLSGLRNDAIHAPLIFVSLDGRDGGLKLEIEPNLMSRNPRGAKLPEDKELQEEFMWYRDHLERLASFTRSLHAAWYYRDTAVAFPWPDKPQLPPRGHYQNRAK